MHLLRKKQVKDNWFLVRVDGTELNGYGASESISKLCTICSSDSRTFGQYGHNSRSMADQNPEMRVEESLHSNNYFVQRVLLEFFQGSPILKVRDACQPSHGSLRRSEVPIPTHDDLSSLHAKSDLVLKHKALHNEDLLPAPVTNVDLTSVGDSTLMIKRRNRKLAHSK